MSDINKELEKLEKEHNENEISDKEYETEKAKLVNNDMPDISVKKTTKPEKVSSPQFDPKLKTLKTIRNLLIALIAIMVIGFGSIIGYIIYTETAYADDFYYDDSGYEEFYDDGTEGTEEEGTLSEDGDVAY